MKPEDIKTLNDNGLCVVEAKNPALVKFLDPIPSATQRGKVEDAAVKLSRKLLNGYGFQSNGYATFGDINKLFTSALIEGTPLQDGPTQAERDQDIFDEAKESELRRLAREEAKAEREAAKQAKQKPAEKKA